MYINKQLKITTVNKIKLSFRAVKILTITLFLFTGISAFTQSAGPDKNVTCSSSIFEADDPNPDIGQWTTAGGQTIANSTLFNSTVSNLNLGLNTFTWTIPSTGFTEQVIISYVPASITISSQNCDNADLFGSNSAPG